MASCPNCHAPLEEGAGFCGVCGTPIPKQVICSHCGQETSAEGKFCERCGQPFGSVGTPEVPVAPAAENPAPAAQPAAPAPETPAAAPEEPVRVICPHCGQATACSASAAVSRLMRHSRRSEGMLRLFLRRCRAIRHRWWARQPHRLNRRCKK